MRRRSRRAGRLGLAVLAVVVATAACGIPTTGGPTAIAKGDVPSNLLNPASPTTATSTIPPEAEVPALIFLSRTAVVNSSSMVTKMVSMSCAFLAPIFSAAQSRLNSK